MCYYKIDLKLDGHKLIPGKDFMIDPHSCAIDGSFKVIKTNLKNCDSHPSMYRCIFSLCMFYYREVELKMYTF